MHPVDSEKVRVFTEYSENHQGLTLSNADL